jgi:pyrimidine operon attenuation protein/uracil phosphoribosyltransferase
MRAMQTLADAKKVDQLVSDLTEAIRDDMDAAESGGAGWALVGIRSRGEIIADRIAQKLGRDRIEDRVGSLDITLYRDDLSEIGSAAVVRTTDIDFAVDGLNVVLVDDVLMTGRSIRAALQSLMDLGRPRRVWLAVLVDRGGRELPIGADHVALDLSQSAGVEDTVDVLLKPTDKKDAIVLRQKQTQQRNAS